jgi:hypothetical protein
MKISNLTLYNYTGKKIILLDNNRLSQEEINEIQNEDDYMDFDHLNQFQELIENRQSFDIEYKDIIANEENKENEMDDNGQNNDFNSLYNNEYNKKNKNRYKRI